MGPLGLCAGVGQGSVLVFVVETLPLYILCCFAAARPTLSVGPHVLRFVFLPFLGRPFWERFHVLPSFSVFCRSTRERVHAW